MIISYNLWYPLGGSLQIWMKRNLYGSLRAKLISALLGMPKWVGPSMNQCRMFCIQISTLSPSMHHKLTNRGRLYLQNNQFLTKSHTELEDEDISYSSVVVKSSAFVFCWLGNCCPIIRSCSIPILLQTMALGDWLREQAQRRKKYLSEVAYATFYFLRPYRVWVGKSWSFYR